MARIFSFHACRHVAAIAVAGMFGLALILVFTKGPAAAPVTPVFLSVFALTTGFSLVAVSRCRSETASEFRAELERLSHLAEHDDLSGLANRRAFTRHLDRDMQLARWCDHPLALVIIDLDDFKLVNDHFGHLVGDAVLTRFGLLLRELCRASDIVARLGGDEFAIIIRQAGEGEARAVIKRLNTVLSQGPILVDDDAGVHVSVGASAGFAVLAPEMSHFTDLVRAADVAQYEVKARRAPVSAM